MIVQHLCAVMPQGNALLLMMRYPNEVIDIGEYNLPEKKQAVPLAHAHAVKCIERSFNSRSARRTPPRPSGLRRPLASLVRSKLVGEAGQSVE